jgi:arsenite methyltransferase
MQETTTAIQARYSQEAPQSCSLGCGPVIERLNLQPGERVLDLGCGSGLESMQAACMVGDEGQVVGLDITADMVEAAIRNAEERQLNNVGFIHGDISCLEFDGDSFDAVQSNCVINHAPDKGRVFQEIYRVLRPGGRFVISDAVSKYPLPDNIKNDPDQVAACFGGAVTEAEYMNSILQAGFQKVEVLKRREYVKNGYDFLSLTVRAWK